jgi:hypothetical protein
MGPAEHDDPVDLELGGADDAGDGQVNLPSFVVLARFAEAAPTAEQAEASVRERLTAARGLYDDVRVERREDDGTWLLEVRFVVVSLDAHTAVEGVSETLTSAGLSPDEVWVPPAPDPAQDLD